MTNYKKIIAFKIIYEKQGLLLYKNVYNINQNSNLI